MIEKIFHTEFSLQCVGNSKFVGVGAEQRDILVATFDQPSLNTLFRMEKAENDTVKIYNVFYRDFVSGYGYSLYGWALRPSVADEPWSHFFVELDSGRDTIRLRSAEPAAADTPWVQTFGAARKLLICKELRDYLWGDFRVIQK